MCFCCLYLLPYKEEGCTQTLEKSFFFSPLLYPPPFWGTVSGFLSPPKGPCGKELASETLAFSSCGKKGAPVLWWPGGWRTACCQGCYSNGFSNQPGSGWETKWSKPLLTLCLKCRRVRLRFPSPTRPLLQASTRHPGTAPAQKSLQRTGHLPAQDGVPSFSLEEWAFTSLFLPAAGKMSRWDESQSRSDLSKSFSLVVQDCRNKFSTYPNA